MPRCFLEETTGDAVWTSSLVGVKGLQSLRYILRGKADVAQGVVRWSGSVGVGSGWFLLLNTDVKYSLNIDAISAGLEAVRVGVDTPSPTPIDMVSGKLDSLLLSLNTDQNLFGLLRRSESRELKKLVRLSLIIFFTGSDLNLARRELPHHGLNKM